MKLTQIIVLSLLLNLFSLTCSGLEFYVNASTGSDANTGLTIENPWKTITYALSKVNGSKENLQTINVASGIYNLSNGEVFPIKMKSYVILKEENDD